MTGRFDSLMLDVLVVPLVTAIQLFAVYVVMHGHYSPGGGFQGGVLLGCSLILPKLVRGGGSARGMLDLSTRGGVALAGLGVFIYASIALLPALLGSVVLDYAALPLPGVETVWLRSLGILGIEIGVTLAVAGAVLSLFLTLFGDVGAEESHD